MYDLSRITSKDIDYIKSQGFPIVEMQHAIRINGCVDVWMNGYKMFDIVINQYVDFDNKKQLLTKAFILCKQYGERNAFKRKNNKISYKEFKHKNINQTAEYYHWKNNKEFSETYLYFIKCGIFVKIGFSKNVEKRLATLSTGMPSESKILAKFKGMGHLEKTLHRCFSELKTKEKGEWFYYDKRIIDFINYAKKFKHPQPLKQVVSVKKEEVFFLETTMPFGKYKGNRIDYIISTINDKSYIKWLSTKKTLHKEVLDLIN